MNISVYLPNNLKERIESYIKSKGITKNVAIRKAVELLLSHDNKASLGSWIDDLKGDPSMQGFESYRSELKKPDEHSF